MYASEHSNDPGAESPLTSFKSNINEIPEREIRPKQEELSEEEIRFLEEQHSLLEYWSDTIG